MCEERIGPRGQHSRREATRAKAPPVCAASEWNQSREAYAKKLKQRHKGNTGAVERELAEKKGLHGNPIPTLAGQGQRMSRTSDESLPRKSADVVRERGDSEGAKRGHHHVAGAARASQADIHEGDPGP